MEKALWKLFVVNVFILTLHVPSLAIAYSPQKLYSFGMEELEKGNNRDAYNYFKRSCNEFNYELACSKMKSIAVVATNTTNGEAIKLYDEKQYDKSFPIFQNDCLNYHSKYACLMLGISYRFGQGTPINLSKAIETLSLPGLENDDWAKVQIAYINEYDYGNDFTIGKAVKIYNQLQSSNNKEISEIGKSGVQREYIYYFLDRVFTATKKYLNDNISYDQLEKILINVDTSKIPDDIKRAFIGWRLPFLKLASNKSSLSKDLFFIGKSALKGFFLDFSFITDAADEWNKDERLQPIKTEEKHYFSLLVERLQANKISAKFWNNLFH